MSSTFAPAGPRVLGLGIAAAPTAADDGWVVRPFRAGPGLDGPPGILQGGLSAGLALVGARLLAGVAAPTWSLRVRLHAPTPLGRDLQVRTRPATDGYEVETRDGAQLLVSGTVRLAQPEPGPQGSGFAALADVPLPTPEPQEFFTTCWVCGAHPAHPHGQRLVPGWHDARSVVTGWTPDPVLADDAEAVDGLLVAAVLDCPTVWASWTHIRDRGDAGALLAGYELRCLRPAAVARPLRTVARCDEVDGRKIRASGALLDEGGTVYATSSALHISVPEIPTGQAAP